MFASSFRLQETKCFTRSYRQYLRKGLGSVFRTTTQARTFSLFRQCAFCPAGNRFPKKNMARCMCPFLSVRACVYDSWCKCLMPFHHILFAHCFTNLPSGAAASKKQRSSMKSHTPNEKQVSQMMHGTVGDHFYVRFSHFTCAIQSGRGRLFIFLLLLLKQVDRAH